jgi:hypothetical protein
MEQTVRRIVINRDWNVFKIEISSDGTILLSVDKSTQETRRATYLSFGSGSSMVEQVESWLSKQAVRPIERRQYANVS